MIHLPTLERDGYRLEADGWGDKGRVPLAIQGERLICAACRVRRRTRVYVVCRYDGSWGPVMAERLTQWGYRNVKVEFLPPPPPDWWRPGFAPD